MVVLAILLVGVVLPRGSTIGADESPGGEPPPVISEPIIGGVEVDPPGTYPFAVYLVVGGSACGGSLLAPTWVVTAAHCVVEGGSIVDPATASVVIGRHDLRTSAGEMIGVVRIAVPNRALTSDSDDIALLELDSPSRFGTPVSVAAASDAAAWSPGTSATLLGWGATQTNGTSPSPVLHEIELPIQPDALCSSIWFGYEAANEICAGGVVGEDGCLGDSGGPLVVPAEDAGWMLIGVVSGGSFPCADGRPGIYTEVASYIWLIEAVTGLDLTPPPPPIEGPASATEPAERLALGR